MRSFFIYISLVTFFLIGAVWADLHAQQVIHQHIHEHPVLNIISEAAETGQISGEEALLQKMYAGFRPDRVDSRFRNDEDHPIKCMASVLNEYYSTKNEMNSALTAEIEELINPTRSSTTESYLAPSGNFIFYYETEGIHAVPPDDLNQSGVPDYVARAAFAADSTYSYMIDKRGFQDFVRDEPYEISFRNMGPYGTTTMTGSTSRIAIHNNFEGFPPNTHPEGNQIGSLYVTIAHEMKHASQVATNRWRGDAGSFDWIEMDATFMEEVIFPDANDYYNYIMHWMPDANRWDQQEGHTSSIFRNPSVATPRAYSHITWMLYFFEKYGLDFWADVWHEIRIDYLSASSDSSFISFLGAMEIVLNRKGRSLPHEHINNHLWHMAVGPVYSSPGFGFRDRFNYPTPMFGQSFVPITDQLSNLFLSSYAAAYVDVKISNATIGQPFITVEATEDGIGVGAVAYLRDGSIETQFMVDPGSSRQTMQTTWSWADLTDLKVAVVNTNRESSTRYTLSIDSEVPDEDTISQNYPNPFNPTTQIEFSLSETRDVRIEVYDRIGRRVRTLVNDRMDRGFHTVTFDGTGLASGLYFYRLVTDQRVETRKMLLIK
ncbi:MAG: T9SS type A sorting domain-containing protein [Balneolaceae bacterium]|nr:T9SS type A sorting domain-containing protein [Balneolaceae bacterium]